MRWWRRVRGLRVGAVYQLAGRYLDILTTHGYSGATGVNISLGAPETPHRHVALRREENVKDDQVEQLDIQWSHLWRCESQLGYRSNRLQSPILDM